KQSQSSWSLHVLGHQWMDVMPSPGTSDRVDFDGPMRISCIWRRGIPALSNRGTDRPRMRTDRSMVEFGSDSTLLERFVSRREEAAFEDLVRRHGPRVERICRRILRNEHDMEDVFQATFLVLARKAAGITWRESIGPWLDSVARRLALHARSGASRQNG